jgi:hypothetical protein
VRLENTDRDRLNVMALRLYGYKVPGRSTFAAFTRDGREFVRARWMDRASDTPCVVTLPKAGTLSKA